MHQWRSMAGEHTARLESSAHGDYLFAVERAPAVAGTFYPDDAASLRATVARLVGQGEAPAEDALAIVAPHAGYVYSGGIAGEVYRSVRVPSHVVVTCPNHTGMGARAAITSHGTWRIPGHAVPIDEPLAEELRGVAGLTEDERAHAREHSLEVQLPFLVHRNPGVRFVPVCLGMLPYESCVRIGTALADVVIRHGGDVLLVASTDMSHYLPADVAKEKDRLALERIEALDPRGLYDTVLEHGISMCGFIPTTVTLIAAAALGATEARLVRYGSSGDASGDYSRVVGYAGFVIR